MDPNNTTEQKQWKKIAILPTYEQAYSRKKQLLEDSVVSGDGKLLVKIRRCGAGGTQYKVKTWHPDSVPKKKTKKAKK